MAHSETVERILDAAEQLFARYGFAETSLRQITTKAKVNLAAVNYHFGSKQSLIQAVLMRVLNPVAHRILLDLEHYECQRDAGDLKHLLKILLKALLGVQARTHFSLGVSLLSRAFLEAETEITSVVSKTYGKAWQRYLLAIRPLLPHLSNFELSWRLRFMLGGLLFALSDSRLFDGLLPEDAYFEMSISTDQSLDMIITCLAAGLSAKPTLTELGS
ncbi:TetR family transcriptional regulator [Azomonas agilis]|uniref:TetR family transcriptional regulator n=1 Tax=Azomonas agilis TaxID=116849 RepID=A0A562I0A5_9GAMM|nr:TetR/AcrR family transcriptional regulator [Azomonas agilis]TWH64073.1 TetR family transcriptional regulator [Azomonas agilis]